MPRNALLSGAGTLLYVSSAAALASYNYLEPALFWNATVKQVVNLGNISTGGQQALGQVVEATLRSEPDFEPSFVAEWKNGEDYLSVDPDGVARPSLVGVVYPDDGDTPFLMETTGIQYPNPKLDEIFGTNTSHGLEIPYGFVYSGIMPNLPRGIPH